MSKLVLGVAALAIASAPLAGQTASRATPPTVAADSSIVLAPGDIVKVTVWRKDELSGELRIGADGTLAHPLYKNVKVAGLPLAGAQDRLAEFLRQYEASPQLVLEPRFRVSVGGDVRQPNLYSLPPETSIAQAVALAGGPTERGRLDRVRLLRQGRELMLDLTSADVTVAQMPVQSGDQIVVGHRRDTVRDVIAPLSSVIAAAASVASLVIRR